jgi:hypothetical protein
MGRSFPEESKMSINTIIIVAISLVAMCGFGFLADMILANWRATEKTKADPFSKLDRRSLLHRQKPTLDCFGACMKEFAWDGGRNLSMCFKVQRMTSLELCAGFHV